MPHLGSLQPSTPTTPATQALVFETSASAIRTWQEARRTRSARFADHEVHLAKPVSEFLGPGLAGMTFNIRFDVRFGMKPIDEMGRLIQWCDTGVELLLVVGEEYVGAFTLRQVDETWKRADRNGNITVIEASISLTEYEE